jgi:hypothetical protein
MRLAAFFLRERVRQLEQQAKGLARAFLAEDTYRPFQFRW